MSGVEGETQGNGRENAGNRGFSHENAGFFFVFSSFSGGFVERRTFYEAFHEKQVQCFEFIVGERRFHEMEGVIREFSREIAKMRRFSFEISQKTVLLLELYINIR